MSSAKQLLLILALTAMWGPSFLFIKLAVEDLPPLSIAAMRVSLAAVIFIGILLWQRRPLPRDASFWVRTGIMALFSSALPFFLFCYAEQSIDSALAALINGSTPMFTALLAQLFVSSDRMHTQKALGIALTSAGVVLLFAPKLAEGISGTTVGMLAALGAAFSYAVSHVYGKLYASGREPDVAPAAQMIAAAAMLWPFALWSDRLWELPAPSLTSLAGVGGLTLFGTVFAFSIYYKLLDHCGPTAISMAASFFPVIGMVLGYLFLGEELAASSLGAAAMILLGMMVVNGVITLPLKAKEAKV